MARSNPVLERLGRRLAWHQALHDPAREPRNALPWLQALRRWQSQRLEHSFAHFLHDPQRRPAAMFFLTDIYGDRDFSRRDADLVKVLPMMQRLMPAALLDTVVDGIELGALTHALDLRMAAVLHALAPQEPRLEMDLYARAYRRTGLPRLRRRQIELIADVGLGLASAVRTPGVRMLLRFARGPARAAGLSQLQQFLEQGFDAFSSLDDAQGFINDIETAERAASQRLFAGHPQPFALD
ncbi:hypothetical protein [Xanthomonas sp. MUS 060]|uniref:FFLEELY motif protein n=1 Tax=Xanthomonas sp. MUS 060 TaxID=1588031 RepID=UPI0005F2FBA3|nr:hypothetical protein [Xanthomonas sp. MUS 060]